MSHNRKKNDEWGRLCKELEDAKADYEAAEAKIVSQTLLKTDKAHQNALKQSLNASKRMTETLEKMRKFHTGS